MPPSPGLEKGQVMRTGRALPSAFGGGGGGTSEGGEKENRREGGGGGGVMN